jgi:hypothetical protein
MSEYEAEYGDAFDDGGVYDDDGGYAEEPVADGPRDEMQLVRDYMQRFEAEQADSWAKEHVASEYGVDVSGTDAGAFPEEAVDEAQQFESEGQPGGLTPEAEELLRGLSPQARDELLRLAGYQPPTPVDEFRNTMSEAVAQGFQALAGAEQAKQERLLHDEQRAEREQEQVMQQAEQEAREMIAAEMQSRGLREVDPEQVLEIADQLIADNVSPEQMELLDVAQRRAIVQHTIGEATQALADRRLTERVLRRVGL